MMTIPRPIGQPPFDESLPKETMPLPENMTFGGKDDEAGKTPSDESALEGWRTQIDQLDTQLLELLLKRQQVVCAIGHYKQVRGLPPLDPERWRRVLEANTAKAQHLGLCPDFVHDLYHLIHDYSLRLESESGDVS